MTTKRVPTLPRLPDQDLIRADEAGARIAIHALGAPLGWPSLRCGAVVLTGGPDGWAETLAPLGWVKLALLWRDLPGVIDRYEGGDVEHKPAAQPIPRTITATTNGSNAKQQREEPRVPVLEWQESTGMLEPGAYPALLSKITEEDGQFGHQLKFTFTILDREGEPIESAEGKHLEQWGWCSAKFGEKTKLYSWAKALLRNKCPKPGDRIDTDVLLNRKCDVVMAEKLTPNGSRVRLDEVVPYRSYTGLMDD